MSTMWIRQKMIEKSIKKIVHRMRANFCEHTSMQRMQIRTFLIWLKSARESNRLVCEKIKYFQFFLIEFLLSYWSSFWSAKSRCNDCIVRFLETILCDFKSYLYSTLFRNDIDLTSCHTRLYNTLSRSRTI